MMRILFSAILILTAHSAAPAQSDAEVEEPDESLYKPLIMSHFLQYL